MPVHFFDFVPGKPGKPGEYMDAIGAQRENISKKFWVISVQLIMETGTQGWKPSYETAQWSSEARMNIVACLHLSYKALRYNGEFLKMYYNIWMKDYSKIINLEDIAEQSYDKGIYHGQRYIVDKKLEEGNAKNEGKPMRKLQPQTISGL